MPTCRPTCAGITSSSRASRRRSPSSRTSRWARSGGALKRKEKLSARLGDVLSMLYLCSATLHATSARGGSVPTRRSCTGRSGTRCSGRRMRSKASFPTFRCVWCAAVVRRLVFPLGRPYVVPSDHLGHEVAAASHRCLADARPPDRRHAHSRRSARSGDAPRAQPRRDAGGRAGRGEDPRGGEGRSSRPSLPGANDPAEQARRAQQAGVIDAAELERSWRRARWSRK